MKISVVTAWGDEHLLAPYFLQHYAYANEILVLMGPGKDEKTLDVCSQFKNVQIRLVDYPNNKWDMGVKQAEITKTVHGVDCDWAIIVDADEFIFPRPTVGVENIWGFLEKADGNVIMAHMWHVYRNIKDKDLDPASPPLFQRRYGDPEIEHHYIKPIVVKPRESQIKWHIGAHRYFDNEFIDVSPDRFHGVHWHWADVDIAIARHRMVAKKIVEPQRWLTNATNENEIRQRCEMHRNDPRLF